MSVLVYKKYTRPFNCQNILRLIHNISKMNIPSRQIFHCSAINLGYNFEMDSDLILERNKTKDSSFAVLLLFFVLSFFVVVCGFFVVIFWLLFQLRNTFYHLYLLPQWIGLWGIFFFLLMCLLSYQTCFLFVISQAIFLFLLFLKQGCIDCTNFMFSSACPDSFPSRFITSCTDWIPSFMSLKEKRPQPLSLYLNWNVFINLTTIIFKLRI